jgi:hypothetical protein
MTAATQDGAASEYRETERGRLFVTLDCRLKGTLKFAQQIEAKEHGQESRLGGKEGTQAEVIGGSPGVHERTVGADI